MPPRGPGSLPAGHRRSASSSKPESPEGEGARVTRHLRKRNHRPEQARSEEEKPGGTVYEGRTPDAARVTNVRARGTRSGTDPGDRCKSKAFWARNFKQPNHRADGKDGGSDGGHSTRSSDAKEGGACLTPGHTAEQRGGREGGRSCPTPLRGAFQVGMLCVSSQPPPGQVAAAAHTGFLPHCRPEPRLSLQTSWNEDGTRVSNAQAATRPLRGSASEGPLPVCRPGDPISVSGP